MHKIKHYKKNSNYLICEIFLKTDYRNKCRFISTKINNKINKDLNLLTALQNII